MIITSNTVKHEYTIPDLRIVGEVDGFENVVERAEIYLHSSVSFDHTHDIFVESDPGVGYTTSVTEEKTLTEFTHFGVDLNTVGIATASFSAFNDLEEDQVVQWCIDTETDTIQGIQDTQEAKALEAKDKVLNPKRYLRKNPITPWQARADQESSES